MALLDRWTAAAALAAEAQAEAAPEEAPPAATATATTTATATATTTATATAAAAAAAPVAVGAEVARLDPVLLANHPAAGANARVHGDCAWFGFAPGTGGNDVRSPPPSLH